MPGFLALLVKGGLWLLGLVLNKPADPTAQGRELGQAQSDAAQEAKANEDIAKARAASDAADRAASSDPGGLRQPDADSRT